MPRAGHPERRGMHGAGLDIDRLQRRDGLHRRHDLLRRERPACRRRSRRGARPPRSNRCRRGRSRWARRYGAAARSARSACAGSSHIRSSMPSSSSHDVERPDVVGRLHDAFAEAEADGEILEVLRRRPSSRHRCRHYRSARSRSPPGSARAPSADAALAPDPAMRPCRPGSCIRATPRPPAGAMRRRLAGLLVIGLLPFATGRSTARSAPP